MALSRDQIKYHIFEDLAQRFERPPTDFKESDNLRKKWWFTDESLRQWGRRINESDWYTGEFTPLEMIACITIGRDPANDPTNRHPNVIDLVYNTQDRPRSIAAVIDVPRKRSKPLVRSKRAFKGKDH
jgi:hypothetical protein